MIFPGVSTYYRIGRFNENGDLHGYASYYNTKEAFIKDTFDGLFNHGSCEQQLKTGTTMTAGYRR